jgi:hypothetical protein
MKNRALLSAFALCFLAAGCDSKKPAEPAQPKVTAAVVPLPPAAPQPPAASANQDAKPAAVAQQQPVQMAQTDAKKAGDPFAAMQGCKKDKCKITLNVAGTTAADCKITADPDKRGVHKDNKGDHIEWTIVGGAKDWEFDTNGIDFGSNRQFSDAHPAGSKKYKVKDANTDTTPTEHAYTMHLKSTADAKVKCSKDPSIVNDVQTPEPSPA